VATLSVIQDLQERRREARASADQLLTRASDEERDLSADELGEYRTHVVEEREVEERIEQLRDDEVRELRAQSARTPADEVSSFPLGEWLTRAISGASGAGAAFTPSEFPARFFDKLSAESVGLRSGFQVITTDRDSVTIPRWTADTTVGWVSEGSAITSTSGVADTVTGTPRKLAGLETISNEVLADSNPSIFEVIAAGLVRNVALTADKGFFQGSGTPPEIQGMTGVTGRQTITTVGSLTNLDKFADALSLLEVENANGGAIVMHPTHWNVVRKIKEVSGSTKSLMQDHDGSGSLPVSRTVFGVPVYLSSQLSTGNIFVYDPAQQVVVRRQDVSVELDRSRLFNSDQSEIRAIARLDFVSINPKSIVHLSGVFTT
jgi:HK97 family phage major capsid protein